MVTKTDEINQKVEAQTGFGSYIAKDLKSTAMIAGGVALGAGAGFAASKSPTIVSAAKKATKWVAEFFAKDKPLVADLGNFGIISSKNMVSAVEQATEFSEKIPYDKALTIGGAAIGLVAASVPNTYEHWREGKKAQLRVEELAGDVIALREQRNTAMNTLRDQAASIGAQNNAIKAIISQGPKQLGTNPEHHLPAESKVAAHEQRNHQASEVGRG